MFAITLRLKFTPGKQRRPAAYTNLHLLPLLGTTRPWRMREENMTEGNSWDRGVKMSQSLIAPPWWQLEHYQK